MQNSEASRPIRLQSHPSASWAPLIALAFCLANPGPAPAFAADPDAPEEVESGDRETWKVVEIEGFDYVSDENVASFYTFDLLAAAGEAGRRFSFQSMTMEWTVGSREISIRNALISLCFPISELDGRAMISTVDLAKTLDPIVRPSSIKDPVRFRTVVIDPGPGELGRSEAEEVAIHPDRARKLALLTKSALKGHGVEAVLARPHETSPDSSEPALPDGEERKAIYLKIDFADSPPPDGGGIRTYALAPQGVPSTLAVEGESVAALPGNRFDAQNIALATAVHSFAINALDRFTRPLRTEGSLDQGIRRSRADALRDLEMPGVLIEFSIPQEVSESSGFDLEDYLKTLADSLAYGAVQWRSAVLGGSRAEE